MKYKNLIATGSLSLGLVGCSGDNLERTLQKTQFITRPVVRKAIENFCDSHMETAFGANTTVRHTVFANEIGENWFERMYAALAGDQGEWYAEHFGIPYEPILAKVREHIMESTRDYLRNPDNLMSAYQQNKESVIDAVREKESTETIGSMLDCALSGEDKYVNEFLERRRAEGGDELVSAYQEIFQDLRQSL